MFINQMNSITASSDLTSPLRREKDTPALMTAQMEENHQRERLEKIQTYRLVRENVLEHRKQQELERKTLIRRQEEMRHNLHVRQDKCNRLMSDIIRRWSAIEASKRKRASVLQSSRSIMDACDTFSVSEADGDKKDEDGKQEASEAQQAEADKAAAQQPASKQTKSAGKRK